MRLYHNAAKDMYYYNSESRSCRVKDGVDIDTFEQGRHSLNSVRFYRHHIELLCSLKFPNQGYSDE